MLIEYLILGAMYLWFAVGTGMVIAAGIIPNFETMVLRIDHVAPRDRPLFVDAPEDMEV